MNIHRYWLACLAVLALLACDKEEPMVQPKPTNPIDVNKSVEFVFAELPRDKWSGELNETTLRAWLATGLPPMSERGMKEPIVRPAYWDSPWRYMGFVYRPTGHHKALRQSPISVLPKGTKADIFNQSHSSPHHSSPSATTDFRVFEFKGEAISCSIEQIRGRRASYYANILTLLRNQDSQAIAEDIYTESIPMFLEHYGTKVLQGYSYGFVAELRTCRVPQQVEALRGQDAEVKQLLSILDEEEDIHSYISEDGARIYYSFRTTGQAYPHFTREELAEKNKVDSKYQKWIQSIWHRESAFMPGSEEFISITEFIPEKNFKYLINQHIQGVAQLPKLQKPYITIGKVEVGTKDNKPFYDLVPVLYTRHGTKVVLAEVLAPQSGVRYNRGGMVNMEGYVQRVKAYTASPEAYEERIKELRERCRQYFAGELRIQSYDKPAMFKMSEALSIESPIYTFPLYNHQDELYPITKAVQKQRVYLCTPHKDTMLCYIDGEEAKYITEEYGISNWVYKLPEREKDGFLAIGL